MRVLLVRHERFPKKKAGARRRFGAPIEVSSCSRDFVTKFAKDINSYHHSGD